MNIDILKAELTTDPLARGYAAMSNNEAAVDLNLTNREANGGASGIIQYMTVNRSRTNIADDTVATSLIGRIEAVANAAIGDDPFGIGVSVQLTREHIHSAKMIRFLLNSPQISTINFVDTEFIAMLGILGGGAGNGRVWKTADINAIKALSQNQQSRGQELGIGRIREGHVLEARL